MRTKRVSNTAEDEDASMITLRVSGTLMKAVDAAANCEGISRADVARRALIRDMRGLPYVSAAA